MAWYPIYRIPEDNFRASFLTFHSLGHLMRRSARINSQTVENCIVCPVVGLQSYNAQVFMALLSLCEVKYFEYIPFSFSLLSHITIEKLMHFTNKKFCYDMAH